MFPKRINRLPRFVMGLVMSGMLCSQLFAQDLKIKTYVDRTQINVGQQFVFTIELSGAAAQGAPVPRLPDLSNFADYAGSSSSQVTQIVNGQMSVSKSNINYYIAKNEGTFQIPAVNLNFQGKTIRSEAIDIKIGPAGTTAPAAPSQPGRSSSPQPDRIQAAATLEGNLFLKATADRRTVYPHQPVIVTYKIYTRVELTNYSVSKLPDLMGFWSEDLDMPQQISTYEEVIEGKKFLVGEVKKTALFPTSPGEKTISPMEMNCEVRLREQRSSSDPFDRFFDDDFFSRSMFGRRVQQRIQSEPIKITVIPLPTQGKPRDYTGAVGEYKMQAAIDKDSISANEAFTLKVTISGRGNIKMLPEPKIVFPPGMETYESKTAQNISRSSGTVRGDKIFEYVVLPRLAGDYTIPSFSFSFFDPDQKDYRLLTSPEFNIKVVGGTAGAVPAPSGLTRQEVGYVGRDIRFIKEHNKGFFRIGAYFYQTFWYGLLLLLPLLGLAGSLVYRRHRDKMEENVAYARSRQANRVAKKRLSRAFNLQNAANQKEFYSEVSAALLGYIADKLNLASAGLMLEEAESGLRKKNIAPEKISEAIECIRHCDYKRFSPVEGDTAEMNTFYNRAKASIIALEKAG